MTPGAGVAPIADGFTLRRQALVPNTLGVRCIADELRTVKAPEGMARCVREAQAAGMPLTIVAGGSNLVLRRRLPGMTVLVAITGFHVERVSGKHWRVKVGAGENWHAVVHRTLAAGIGGLENLALIPGSAGAAPVQNIGAYGRELKDVLDGVEVLDSDGLGHIPASACAFSYRDSVFKRSPGTIITSITMTLGHQPLAVSYPDVQAALTGSGPLTSRGVAAAVMRIRRRKLPNPGRWGNVGSFFKNPILSLEVYDALRARLQVAGHRVGDGAMKVPAARLIDAAGWKGSVFGQVQVWPTQPLVLVNLGGATGTEVLDVARRIQDDVAAKYGVRLHLEPTVLGVDR